MNSYYRRTAPEDLTILEQLEYDAWAAKSRQADLDKTLAHYQEQLRMSNREQQLKDFFKRFDNMTEADAQEVQEMAFELGVTFEEFRINAEAKREEVQF